MVVDENFLICYNFLPLTADHVIDFPKSYYESCGVVPLHDESHFDPMAVKTGDSIFVKTDFIVNDHFRQNVFDNINLAREFNIITGNSAYQIGRDGGDQYKTMLFHPKIKHWFCTNPPEVKSDKIIPLPIGFEEPDRDGGSQKTLLECLNNRCDYNLKSDNIFLPYHTINTNKNRNKAVDYLKGLHFVDTQNERRNIKDYLKIIDKYKFTICLEGAGPDTHRNYEALLVGSVPIMKNSTIKKVFDYHSLPGIFVDSWEELNESFFENILNENYNFNNVENFLKAKTHINMVRGK